MMNDNLGFWTIIGYLGIAWMFAAAFVLMVLGMIYALRG
jgi:hypothetical protein